MLSMAEDWDLYAIVRVALPLPPTLQKEPSEEAGDAGNSRESLQRCVAWLSTDRNPSKAPHIQGTTTDVAARKVV
ncbi:hypothetical protein GH714_040050 [Hevea brasiliensis]|uniref:Uncharacterized protein n=1 Tax=Hevea brasiliensis TaxID=3981 RepID=A0A6A6MQQ4_HEVBR|nr:hypothetical protein GH714_040050 [Hevea brasiliensis]